MQSRIDIHDILEAAAGLDWTSVSAATDRFSERVVPGLKMLHAAQNDAEARTAYDEFENSIVVQGDLFDAALFSAPFLIALLETDLTSASQLAVLEILFEIANGYAGFDNITRASWVGGKIRYLRPADDVEGMPLQVWCRAAVATLAWTIVQCVGSSDARVHAECLVLLESLSGFNGVIKSVIQRRLAVLNLSDNETRRTIYRTLNSIG